MPMADAQTTGELFKAKAILEENVAAAVDAYMTDPEAAAFQIAKYYRIDLAVAVADSKFARDVVANLEASDALKRGAVRTAILLARPTKGRWCRPG